MASLYFILLICFVQTASGQMSPWAYDKGVGNDNLYKKNYKEAITAFTKCISENQKADECYFGRGKAQLALGNKSAAKSDFQKAIKINPKNQDAAIALASLPPGDGSSSDADKETKNKTGGGTSTNANSVTNINRLNFYTGMSFMQTGIEASAYANSFNETPDALDGYKNFYKRARALFAILKGAKEQIQIQDIVNKVQKDKDFKDANEKIIEQKKSYISTLNSEQNWYFSLGGLFAESISAFDTDNVYMLIVPEMDLPKLLAEVPAQVPRTLLSLLGKTVVLLNHDNFDAMDSAPGFAKLKANIFEVLESIGSPSSSDLVR